MVDLGLEARKSSLRTCVLNLGLKGGFKDTELYDLFAKCLVNTSMNVCICLRKKSTALII